MAPPGKGLVLVIVGGTVAPTIVKENAVGPAFPAVLVAVIFNELTATTLGVPVSNPEEERDAHAGRPVPVQVIGAVPVAVN